VYGLRDASNGVESFFSNLGTSHGLLYEFVISGKTDDKSIDQSFSGHVIQRRESERRSSELLVTHRRRPSEEFRLRPGRPE
jgi:hypothetical protein